METKTLKKILLAVSFAIICQSGFAQDKVPNTPEEKRTALLTPEYYTHWVGASFFTIPTVEKEFDVTPAQILDLTFFYDFDDCFVGMESNENGVVVQMTLRLFADKATEFVQKAVDYGYELIAEGENVNVRSNTGELVPEIYTTLVGRYSKSTAYGNVYIEVANSGNYANEYEISIYRAK